MTLGSTLPLPFSPNTNFRFPPYSLLFNSYVLLVAVVKLADERQPPATVEVELNPEAVATEASGPGQLPTLTITPCKLSDLQDLLVDRLLEGVKLEESASERTSSVT